MLAGTNRIGDPCRAMIAGSSLFRSMPVKNFMQPLRRHSALVCDPLHPVQRGWVGQPCPGCLAPLNRHEIQPADLEQSSDHILGVSAQSYRARVSRMLKATRTKVKTCKSNQD